LEYNVTTDCKNVGPAFHGVAYLQPFGSVISKMTEESNAPFTQADYCYMFVLILQLLMILVDILCNCLSVLFGDQQVTLLIMLIIQDSCLVFSLILLFLVFFNTFAFKAGLLGLLVKKFRGTIAILFLYLLLTIIYQLWSLILRWDHSGEYIWNNSLQALYVFQKLCAVFHYYLYKRAAFTLSDNKYYHNSEWIKRELR